MKEFVKGGDLGDDLPVNSKSNTEPAMRMSQKTIGFGTIPVKEGIAKASLDEGPSDATQYGYTSDPNRPLSVMRKFRWSN